MPVLQDFMFYGFAWNARPILGALRAMIVPFYSFIGSISVGRLFDGGGTNKNGIFGVMMNRTDYVRLT